MSSQIPFIVCIMGPTASGKTQLAVELSARLPVDIISVDSAMIYRGMDIGTAKPGPELLKVAPHRLIDIRDPAESYSAGQFTRDAVKEIDEIIAKGRIPLLVGGTMLYFRALQRGLNHLPVGNASVRLEIKEQADQIGWPALHEQLSRIDAVAAKRIHPHDAQRISRALEVYEVSGKTLTEWQASESISSVRYRIINCIVAPTARTLLHQRIEQRLDFMLANGLIDEVKTLFARADLTLEHPSVRAVGYRQVWEYLLERVSQSEMRDRAVFATRQFAKRQLTWLRSWEDAQWFDAERPDLVDAVIEHLRF